MKKKRISLRVSLSQKAIIARAAQIQQSTLTEFLIDHALDAAYRIVSECRHFEMTPAQFQRFCRSIDSPPARNLAIMRKLLNEPTVLG
jgi:uncharacterized protein (DUF1778 family)